MYYLLNLLDMHSFDKLIQKYLFQYNQGYLRELFWEIYHFHFSLEYCSNINSNIPKEAFRADKVYFQ